MENKQPVLEIRNPISEKDVAEAQRAQDEAWGSLDIVPDDIPKILSYYPEGFFAAYVDGVGAGNMYLVKLKYDMDNPVRTWTEVSGNGTCSTHDPEGETLYAISLGVSPKFRGMKIGQKLVERAIKHCEEANCKRLVLGCRIPEYHNHADMAVEDYIQWKDENGDYYDPELRFYARCGLTFTKPMPEYMSEENADPDSLNYGVMSVWENPNYQS